MNANDSSFSNPHRSSPGEKGDRNSRFQPHSSEALSRSTTSLPHSQNDPHDTSEHPLSFASSSLPIAYPIGSATLQVSGIHVQVAYVKEEGSSVAFHKASSSSGHVPLTLSTSSSSSSMSSPRTPKGEVKGLGRGGAVTSVEEKDEMVHPHGFSGYSKNAAEEANSDRLRLRQVVQVELRAVVKGKENFLLGKLPPKHRREKKKRKEVEVDEMQHSHMLGVLYLALPSPSVPLVEQADKRRKPDTGNASTTTSQKFPASPSLTIPSSFSSSSSSRFNPFSIPMKQKKTFSSDDGEKEREVERESLQRREEEGKPVGTITSHRVTRASQDASPASVSSSFSLPHSMPCSSLLFPSFSSSASGLSSTSSFFLPRGLYTSCSFMPLDLRVQNEFFTVVAIVRVLETKRVFPYVHKTLWKRQREIEVEEGEGAMSTHAFHEKEVEADRRGGKGKERERAGDEARQKGFLPTDISASTSSPWRTEGRRIQVTVAITGSVTSLA